jgi:hypothetical protein
MAKKNKIQNNKKSKAKIDQPQANSKQVKTKNNSSSLLNYQSPKKVIDYELRKIYQDDKGKLPKMTDLEFKKRNPALKFILFVIISLTIIFSVAFLGFLVFQPKPKFTSEKVSLEIKAPFTATSGEDIFYKITINNAEDINLTKSLLTVYFPAGFIFDNANPSPMAPDQTEQPPLATSNIKTWQINDIFINQSRTIEIQGKFIANLNSKQTVSATLSYTPANFSSEFQKNVSFDTDVTDSLLGLNIEAPNQIADQDNLGINLKINNNSDKFALQNIKIELAFPPEFVLASSQIFETDKDNLIVEEKKKEDEIITSKTWQIDNLAPQAEKQIKIKGSFNAKESLTAAMDIKAELKGPNDRYFTQREEKIIIEVIKGELLTNLIIQGSDKNQPVNFGDTLNYLIRIQNKSKNLLGDIKIRAVLDSKFLDWSSLVDKNNGLREENQILWTKDQINKLANLLPEEELAIPIQINLINYKKSINYKTEDFKIQSFYEAQINKLENNPAEIVLSSNTIINEINTDLALSATARYYGDNNTAIGSGPLPPVVNQKTNYKLLFKLSNSLHEITNIEVKAKLPDYVSYNDQNNTSTGNVFKNDRNEIIWQISRIPTSVNLATAEVGISITPTEQDVHKILTLVSGITLTAKDAQTQGQIAQSLIGLTTNLDTDPLAEGKGLVQAAK